MRRSAVLATLLLAAATPRVHGQATTTAPDSAPRAVASLPRPANDSLFRRARRLVSEGNGVAGRALVDSLLRAADPATPAYGDALYWHGALAPTAAAAERDYRRVIVEYPLAFYADDALLAIAELEQARGDRAGALQHLQRYVRARPASRERGIAALGAARLAFEQRDTPTGCAMLTEARQSIGPADVELRNQVDYYRPRCPSSSTVAADAGSAPPPSTVATAAPAAPLPAPRPAPAAATMETRPVGVPTRPAPAPAGRREPAANVPPAPRPTAPAKPALAKPPATTKPAVAKSTTLTRGAGAVTAKGSPGAPSGPRSAARYTVQLAAYSTRPDAERLVAKLATRGVKARVSGTAKPFRVRLDFYRTRKEAADVVAGLKARGIVGFVTEETPPAGTTTP
jgi:cell division septation protein DedD